MTKTHFRYSFALTIALLLQITVVDYMRILNWRPDLVLIILVMFAIQCGPNAGSTAGFVIGLLSDVASGAGRLLGLGALTKSVAGFVASVSSDFFQERGQFVYTLLVSGLVQDVLYLSISTVGSEINWVVLFVAHLVPNLLFSVILGLAIYFSIGRWLRQDEVL